MVRSATSEGFRYRAGEEAGTFIDLLRSAYSVALKARADWLANAVAPLSDEEIDDLVRSRMHLWDTEFQADHGART